ncbi:hypothetical protein N7453_009736 [Penicillium expansum]|nr:hypothetical protein N7453_009736 [Penicillium expansum]
MPKIAWSLSEEENLHPWLLQHRGMSWKAKSKAYFRQFGLKRTGESLRGKQNYLSREHLAMHTRLSEASQSGEAQPRVRHEEASRILPPSPPSFTPRASSAKTRHLLHVMQHLVVLERRFMTRAPKGTDQILPGEMERQPWATVRLANDLIGYTIQMPHTLRSDPSRYVGYRRKFIRRVAAALRASQNVEI